QANGKWVQADVGQPNAPVKASAAKPSTWERFKLEDLYVRMLADEVQKWADWALNGDNWLSETPEGNDGIDVDGVYGAQCVDLGMSWSNWLGKPIVSLDGNNTAGQKNAWKGTNYSNLKGVQPGDIVSHVGGRRHAFVVLTAPDANGNFTVLEQRPDSPHKSTYNVATSGTIWRTDGSNASVEAAASYTVAYDGNGGSGAPAAQTKNSGSALALSSAKPTRSGYTFLGWGTSAAATTASYKPGDSYTANANTTLYAVWLKVTVSTEASKNTIKDTSAVLWGSVTKSSAFRTETIGIRIYQGDKLIKEYTEASTNTGTYHNPYYDTKDELKITLAPGTAYSYQILAKVNGDEFWSAKASFTTTRPASVPKVQQWADWALNSKNWNSKTPSGNGGIDVDGVYGAQCVDLGKSWSNWLGKPIGLLDGNNTAGQKNAWKGTNYLNLKSVQPGDIVSHVGGRQHAFVVLTAPDANGNFTVLEQNPASPHKSTYNVATSGTIWRTDGSNAIRFVPETGIAVIFMDKPIEYILDAGMNSYLSIGQKTEFNKLILV
ncbi:MAG: InlB B-repeat-containing protein, partial [Coriobacteriia bacterium]|nr:InlB B-repeat-containing protein [Coriobacteriia bacterium]